jgi:hypothetical protein
MISKSGANAGDFTVNPGAQGSRSATLTIQGDDAGNPSDTVTLTGTGTAPIPTMGPHGVLLLALALVLAGAAAAGRYRASG